MKLSINFYYPFEIRLLKKGNFIFSENQKEVQFLALCVWFGIIDMTQQHVQWCSIESLQQVFLKTLLLF